MPLHETRTTHYLSTVTSIVVGVAVATLGSIMAGALFLHPLTEVAPYDMTDNLISYEGGFIRRGLLGAVLYAIPFLNTWARTQFALKLLFASNFALLFWMVGLALHRYVRSVSVSLLILLQPFFFGFLVMTAEWTRKDALLMSCFCLSLGALREDTGTGRAPRRRVWPFLSANLVSIAAILSHEMYGVAMLPVLIVAAASQDHAAGRSAIHSLRRAIMGFSPSIATFILLSMFVGDAVVGARILDAWRAKGVALESPGALRFLVDQNVYEGLNDGIGLARDPKTRLGLLYWAFIAMWSAVVLVLSSSVGPAHEDVRSTRGHMLNDRSVAESAIVVALTAASFAPLFLVAIDWGRWIALWLMCSAVLVFSSWRNPIVSLLRSLLAKIIVIPSLRIPTLQRSWGLCLLNLSIFLPLPCCMHELCCDATFVQQWSLAYRSGRVVVTLLASLGVWRH